MVDKLIIDIKTKEIKECSFTSVELKQRELERQRQEEQELLDSLIPSYNEMLMAEVEIQTITILKEAGLI